MQYKNKLIAPIPYRNNVINIKLVDNEPILFAPIPYRNNVIRQGLDNTTFYLVLQFHIGIM